MTRVHASRRTRLLCDRPGHARPRPSACSGEVGTGSPTRTCAT